MSNKPVLKWAGGKTQLLSELLPRMPQKYNNYIEPFIGGGALFFAAQPERSIISDSNPELINLYLVLSRDVERVMKKLDSMSNTEEEYYAIRNVDWTTLSPIDAAARTIYLNKTCFNGLYRVNKSGDFNVPYGKNKRTKFYNELEMQQASKALSRSFILCADYHKVLSELAQPGDFVYLDPPYIPVSEYSDFKRYTKEQFNIDDQAKLADDVHQLVKRGCLVMLTNSNHPLVSELYGSYRIEVFKTKRTISKDASRRNGEDVIITTY